MKLLTHVVLGMQQNVYIYFDEETKEGVIVDPGNDAEDIDKIVKENGINVKLILLTHGHEDHIGAVPFLRTEYQCRVCAHRWEIPVIEEEAKTFAYTGINPFAYAPDLPIEDGDKFKIADAIIRVIYTPGHTQGGVCFYDETNGVLFSGDTLFHGSIGRTDFPNPPMKDGIGYPSEENTKRLLTAIHDKLYVLPDETVVYPGHGNKTSIGLEKKYNPFIRG